MQDRELAQRFAQVGLHLPRLLLPRPEIDYRRWAVIACDQFTSDLEYWKTVETTVGSAPSTLRLMLPECFLGRPDQANRIDAIHAAMEHYLDEEVLQETEPGLVLVERRPKRGEVRRGLLAAIDLERYDYREGTTSLIRATEGTIPERIPPRTMVRRGAPLEVSHVLVLYDDPGGLVLSGPLAHLGDSRKLYDFDLMCESGRITGHQLGDEDILAGVVAAFERLADPSRFAQRYGTSDVLLFAVGDGNHSLAAAKSVWEQTKRELGLTSESAHPGRYALVELVNIHDEGLLFEPIHRVLFDEGPAFMRAISDVPQLEFRRLDDVQAMYEAAAEQSGVQRVGVVSGEEIGVIEFAHPSSTLAAGTFQSLLDGFLASHPRARIDYIHGSDATLTLGRIPTNAGFFLPPLKKSDFFPTIVGDGCLPRKTFSMGEAEEKRFYLEARRISIARKE